MFTFAQQHLKGYFVSRPCSLSQELVKFFPRQNCRPQAGWKTTHSREHGEPVECRWSQLVFVASRWCWCWWFWSRSWWTPPGPPPAMRCSDHVKWFAILTGPQPRPRQATRSKTTASSSLFRRLFRVRKGSRGASAGWVRGVRAASLVHLDLLVRPGRGERLDRRVPREYPEQTAPTVQLVLPLTARCQRSRFTQDWRSSTKGMKSWNSTTSSQTLATITTPPRGNSPAQYRGFTFLCTMCWCEAGMEPACGLISVKTTR